MATAIKKSWHAVCVVPGGTACAAAQRLRGQRFLSPVAPRLPLPDCSNQNQCQCKYQHMADRRGEPRRSDDVGVPATPRSGERRRPGERRERRK